MWKSFEIERVRKDGMVMTIYVEVIGIVMGEVVVFKVDGIGLAQLLYRECDYNDDLT